MTNEKEQNEEMDEETLNKELGELPPLTLKKALRKELGFSENEARDVAQFYQKFKTDILIGKPLKEVLSIIETNDKASTASKEGITDNDLLKP